MAPDLSTSPEAERPKTNGSDSSLVKDDGEGRSSNVERGAFETTAEKALVVEDDEYFLESSFVFFQVENTLFHIPSYRFTNESLVFAGMFKLPQSDPTRIEGTSRDNPIVLPDAISRVDFRNFLKALYPLPVAIRLSLSKSQWLSVLKLSSFWYFLSFRKIAITELEKTEALTPTEKVTWGRHVKISSWVIKGYQEIIQRTLTIGKEEAMVINYETTFALFRLREDHIRNGGRVSTVDLEAGFKDELENIRAEEKGYVPEEEACEELPVAQVAAPAMSASGSAGCSSKDTPRDVSSCYAPGKKSSKGIRK